MNARLSLLFLIVILLVFSCQSPDTAAVFIRHNLVGYLPEETKEAIAFSSIPVQGSFSVIDTASGESVLTAPAKPDKAPAWGDFLYYTLDFSSLKTPGAYYLQVGEWKSAVFQISDSVYGQYHELLVEFMQQQRCGDNPFLSSSDEGYHCHSLDGKTMYGPMPDSTHMDFTGGWHDAGDQLKYLITGSNATARMILASELYHMEDKFSDVLDENAGADRNGTSDLLDEAKWGLDWIHKLHPAPDQLFHQIADDRDHIGWKMPLEDKSDYGWGPNSYRVAYFADGKPQGLGKYKSQATGVANLAGRSAAAMAMAYSEWTRLRLDETYAKKCLKAAKELYQMGLRQPGFQQGNSFSAPYRYNEDTWTDDMEWGAAELYKATGEKHYLDDAIRFARLANTQTSWMGLDTAEHYRYYPFVNVAHYSLYKSVDGPFKDTLAMYYRTGIEQCMARGKKNPFNVGAPFIWCSNNLMVALCTQIILYEDMTGDLQYHDFLLAQRDWLLGRNPWGTSMFTGIPTGGEYPVDVHTSVWMMTKREAPGGLVDGPVSGAIHRNQKGLVMAEPDEFAEVQNGVVVYHDDNGDYATNEPTMDGTAGAILMMAYWGAGK
ncbi:MAG: glycoside hydrolase family 9 protein [Bacteroidia bacterium]